MKYKLVCVCAVIESLCRMLGASSASTLNWGWASMPAFGVTFGAAIGLGIAVLSSTLLAAVGVYQLTFGVFSLFIFAISAVQAGLFSSKKLMHNNAAYLSVFVLIAIWAALSRQFENTLPMIFFYSTAVISGIGIMAVGNPIKAKAVSNSRLMASIVLIAYTANMSQCIFEGILTSAFSPAAAMLVDASALALVFYVIEQMLFALVAGALVLFMIWLFKVPTLLIRRKQKV